MVILSNILDAIAGTNAIRMGTKAKGNSFETK